MMRASVLLSVLLAGCPNDNPCEEGFCLDDAGSSCVRCSALAAACDRVGGETLCVAGDAEHCAGGCRNWTGTVCCVSHAEACADGNLLGCSDDNEAWTGAQCCILAE